jgi:hypothetical protein
MFSQIFGIVWRLIVVIITCYLAVAVLIYFLKPRKLDMTPPDQYGQKILRLTLRPILDLGFEHRVSIDSDWQEYRLSSFRQKESDGDLVKVSNGAEKNYQDFMSVNWYDLNNPSQSLILQPENVAANKTWFLVRCVEKNNILYCQKNKIAIKELVKTSIFKNDQNYFGVSENDEFIKLKSIQTINTDQRKDVLYI